MYRQILFVNDYPMDVALKRWREGNYPGHHLWGMQHLTQLGKDVEFSSGKFGSKVFSFLDKVGIDANKRWQILSVFKRRSCPNIYCGSIQSYRILGILKSMGLLNCRIAVMIHHPVTSNRLDRRALRYADVLFFLNHYALEGTLSAMPELESKSKYIGWCLDTDFYDKGKDNHFVQSNKLIVAAGKELRDYDALVEGVSQIEDPDLRIEIYCSAETAPTITDPRISVFSGPQHGSSISYLDLLSRYREAIAIAVPLLPASRTVGLTRP